MHGKKTSGGSQLEIHTARSIGSGSVCSFGGASVLASLARQEPRPTKLTHYRSIRRRMPQPRNPRIAIAKLLGSGIVGRAPVPPTSKKPDSPTFSNGLPLFHTPPVKVVPTNDEPFQR